MLTMRWPTLVVCFAVTLPAQQPPTHGDRPVSVLFRDVMVIRGDRTPPYGPTDVLIKDGLIAWDGSQGRATGLTAETTIDGAGCWLLPGLVSTHAHLQEEAAGMPIETEYQLDLWLACGITAVRDVGSTPARSLRLRSRQRSGELAAPRLFLWHSFGVVADAEAARARVRQIREQGADGIKLWSNYTYPREILAAILDEAKVVQLPVTAHIGTGESTAVDYAELGVRSIEHWYGIPDAALRGVQHFPPEFSYSNEVDRFRYAGRLWREADPKKLQDVLQVLVDHHVAWSPTLAVYEASRDLVRAQNQPWFAEWLHPALQRFFTPNLANHGSYFLGWTSTDEASWRENYRIWMAALRDFAGKGGVITTGEDAAYIYLLYGFGLVRELELHLEAGFEPLEVIQHATSNGALVLGQSQHFGRVRDGMQADLCLVRGNPLQNLKVFYPTGCDEVKDGRSVPTGTVQWTIVDGRCWHAPTLAAQCKAIVAASKAALASKNAGK
jgi:hypothetical protein